MESKANISRAVIECLEQRKLLAFTPAGAPVQVDPAATTVVGVEASAGLSDGRHAVVYTVATDVFVRLYNADGTPVAAAQQVNDTATGANPDVAITADGSFVVAFQAADSDGSGIYVRQYAGTGVATGASVLVNTSEVGAQTAPRVGIDGTGNFTVVWETDDGVTGPRIFGQRFTSLGVASGSEIFISDPEDSVAPDIGMTASGVSVVVWNNTTSTLAQRIDATGVKTGGIITIDNETGTQPSVGVATDGSFIVAWSIPDVGIERDIVYRRYNNAGSPVSSQQAASSDPTLDEQFPQIDVAGTGKFVISWAEASTAPGTYDQIGFRAFTSAGNNLGTDTTITGVGFSGDVRHGAIFRDTQPVRIAYQSTADAFVQEYENTLSITLGNGGDVLQILGSGSNLRVVLNGVVTNYPADEFIGVVITGGDGNDYIRVKNTTLPVSVFGGAGNDTITTAEGNDYVEGGLGNDAINLGDGDDYAIGNDETDTLYGGNGNDTLTGGPGRNLMFGEAGDDLLGGGNRPDTMYGGPGNDRLLGRQGGDALFGEDGDDTLDGGTGNDGILGGKGNDLMIGGPGNDTLRGGLGDDDIQGGDDIDYLYGDGGFDILNGGLQGDYGYADPLDTLISIEIRRNVP
jgi:Ca2+-binding RTX toxin-like protein